MPLARQLASRYRHAGESLEDLVQVACVGLIKAVDRYDPDRGNGFTRYAVPTMLGEIKRHFRDKGWSVHVPRATQELVLKVGEALGALPARLGRSPTPRDIAAAVGASVEDVLEAMEAATAYEAVSLDAPRPGSGEEESWTLAESLSDDEHGLRARRDRGDAARHAGGTARARAADTPPAVRGGPHAGGDRRAGRRLPDARLTPAAPLARPPFRSGRRRGVACRPWRQELASRPEVAALIARGEERGCVNLSELDELVAVARAERRGRGRARGALRVARRRRHRRLRPRRRRGRPPSGTASWPRPRPTRSSSS